MNTKFDVGQRVTYPVVHTADGNITGIAVSKAGVTRYAIGPKWYAEEDLNLAVGEKPVTKPAESEPEPVKLYCVKSFMDDLSAGKIYEPDESGHIAYNDGRKSNHSVSDWEFDFIRIGNLCALVRRPAKVGEWVYIDNAHINDNSHIYGDVHNGAIFKVGFVGTGSRPVRVNCNTWLWEDEYLVLDGYHGDPA